MGLADNSITDVTPLVGLVNLGFLRLAGNEIADLRPLLGLATTTITGVVLPDVLLDANLAAAVRAQLDLAAERRLNVSRPQHAFGVDGTHVARYRLAIVLRRSKRSDSD